MFIQRHTTIHIHIIHKTPNLYVFTLSEKPMQAGGEHAHSRFFLLGDSANHCTSVLPYFHTFVFDTTFRNIIIDCYCSLAMIILEVTLMTQTTCLSKVFFFYVYSFCMVPVECSVNSVKVYHLEKVSYKLYIVQHYSTKERKRVLLLSLLLLLEMERFDILYNITVKPVINLCSRILAFYDTCIHLVKSLQTECSFLKLLMHDP